MNPYRVFYTKQAEWHQLDDVEQLKSKHEIRSRYYDWHTRGWLPKDKSSKVLDIGCGSGQFMYFLQKQGYKNVAGVDLDAKQVELAQQIGLNAHCVSAHDFLEDQNGLDLIVMLDILEHMTLEELYPLMEKVTNALNSNGRLIVSVPNAESPNGLLVRCNDITHELIFSESSLSQLFYCHDMRLIDVHDPDPSPVSLVHKMWRSVVLFCRRLEALRYKLLGLSSPKLWSGTFWAIAEK